ncbi:MAG: DUF308 domain-containing protein [Muribaculum sp.]|nr:DUF308 domain-containing protein [Muribaculum sp.]
MSQLSSFRGKIHRLWWIPLITGIVGIALGIWCLLSPSTSLPVFAYVVCWGFVAAGLLNLVYACVNTSIGSNWGWSLALGLLELICGIWMLTLPDEVLTYAFVFAIGIWLIIAAINSISETAMLARFSPGWMIWTVLLLIATIFFAIYFLCDPLFGGIAAWIWLGISLLSFGCYRIALAFQIRSINNKISRAL